MTPTGNPLISGGLGRIWWIVFVIAVAVIGYVAANGGDDKKQNNPGINKPDNGESFNPGSGVTVKVDRYVDGDTAKVYYEGKSEYVRYIGVDTPETVKEDTPVECFGEEASAFNRNAVTGKSVRLVFDKERRDRYGRLLAYVYVDGSLLNAEILAGGYGTTIEVPPNTSMAGKFGQLQSLARDDDKGLWGAC